MSDAGFQYTQQHYEEELAFRQRTENSLHTYKRNKLHKEGCWKNNTNGKVR
jgi:hypothetical protein